jgi:hypothetical protein
MLRHAEGACAAAVAVEEAERRQAEADERPGRIARARDDVLTAADKLVGAAEALRRALDASIAAKVALADLVDDAQLRRANQVAHQQAISAIAPIFDVPTPNGSGSGGVYNLLGLRSIWVGPRAHLSLRQLDEELLDDTAAIFATEAAAEAARQRLAARNTPTIIVPLGGSGCWGLVRHDDLFAERAEAERAVAAAARGGRKLAVVAHPPGFVVRPAHLAA